MGPGDTAKRLVKSPKIYVRDSGLVHALLRLETLNDIAGHPVAGMSWEGFVIEKLLGVAPPRTLASFYRTSAGAEIDLVLELPGKERQTLLADHLTKRCSSGRPGAARPGRKFAEALRSVFASSFALTRPEKATADRWSACTKRSPISEHQATGKTRSDDASH
jgi:hypothetical protein